MFPVVKRKATTNVRKPNGSITRKRYNRVSTNFISSVEGNNDKILGRICRHHKKGAALTDAPDGIYTWIMYKNDGAFEIYAGKIRSNQELGTLHQNLQLCAHKAVQFAGELRKTGHTVDYNLQSGTYMARKFKSMTRLLMTESKTGKALTEAQSTNETRQAQNKQIHDDNVRLRRFIQSQVEATFQDIGLTPTFLEAPETSEITYVYGGLPIIEGLEIILEEGGSTNRSLGEVYSE